MRCFWTMPQLVPAAVLDQQMPANQIRYTRAVLEAIVPDDRATGRKLGTSEEIADLLKRSAVLQREAHQAGDDVVEADQFGGTVWTLQTKEDFGWMYIVMDAEVERALAGNSDLLCGMVAAGGEGTAVGHAATTSRSIAKLRGCSVVCWVPLGTPHKGRQGFRAEV